MSYATSSYDEMPCVGIRSARRVPPELVVSTIGLIFTVSAIAWLLSDRPVPTPVVAAATSLVPAVVAVMPDPVVLIPRHVGMSPTPVIVVPKTVVAALSEDPLLDPSYSLGYASLPLADSAPLAADFQGSAPPPAVVVAEQQEVAPVLPPVPAAPTVSASMSAPLPVPRPAPDVLPNDQTAAAPEAAEMVPFPTPRPPEFDEQSIPDPVRIPSRPAARPTRSAVLASAPPDNRSFFDKVFGTQPQPQPKGMALAYAAPEATSVYGRAADNNTYGRPSTSGVSGRTPEPSTYGRASENSAYGRAPSVTSNSMISPDRFTAVYDIAAHTVYMPDGTRLEAHSGLGDKLDDPRHVMERNRGATPPNVYELQPREALFHGVRALRLNPVGNSSVFGRTGLLAHSYMLGPNGDSNGCVSFRNYNAFLQAFSSGSVRRLAVVGRSS